MHQSSECAPRADEGVCVSEREKQSPALLQHPSGAVLVGVVHIASIAGAESCTAGPDAAQVMNCFV